MVVERCLLCAQPIKNKLYVQAIPGVECIKNKFVCAAHLDLCTACWGPHQSFFQGQSSAEVQKDHFWATKAFHRGKPAAAPYFYYADENVQDKSTWRREKPPHFECCHPFCFCLKCNKPKIISRFVPHSQANLYCQCAGTQIAPKSQQLQWQTYGSLGSATRSEALLTLPYIFFPFMKSIFSHSSQNKSKKMAKFDVDAIFHRMLTKAEIQNCMHAIIDTGYFCGWNECGEDVEASKGMLTISNQMAEMFQYIYHCFEQTFKTTMAACIKSLKDMPKRNGREVFRLIENKRYRLIYVSLLLDHLVEEEPWGTMDEDQLWRLVRDLFDEWGLAVRSEADKSKAEQSYMLWTTPQIILQGDLGINIFGRGLHYTIQRQPNDTIEEAIKLKLVQLTDNPDIANIELDKLAVETMTSELLSVCGDAQGVEEHKYVGSLRYEAFDPKNGLQRFQLSNKILENLQNSLNKICENELDSAKPLTTLNSLLVAERLMNNMDAGLSSTVGGDVLRAALGESECTLFQKGFTAKLADIIILEQPWLHYPFISEPEAQRLKRGIYASGVASSLAMLASPHFKNTYSEYMKALKEASRNGNESTIKELEKAMLKLLENMSHDSDNMFVSREGKVGGLLLLAKKLTSEREKLDMPESVQQWFLAGNSSQKKNATVDPKVLELIDLILKEDQVKLWNIATPTIELFVQQILEKGMFAEVGEEEIICDVEELIRLAEKRFAEVMNDFEKNPSAKGTNEFEKLAKLMTEVAKRYDSRPIDSDLASKVGNIILDASVTSKNPKELTPFVQATTAVIDPESTLNNPGILKVSAEAELGINSSTASESAIDQLKKQFANQKPKKKSSDIILDLINSPNYKSLFVFEQKLNEDYIDEVMQKNVYQFLTNPPESWAQLNAAERFAVSEKIIFKNPKSDLSKKDDLCHKVIDSINNEELKRKLVDEEEICAEDLLELEAEDELIRMTEDDEMKATLPLLYEIARVAADKVDQSEDLLAQAGDGLETLHKNFKELRELATSAGRGLDPEDLAAIGLSKPEEAAACRRYLTALIDAAQVTRGLDSPQMRALIKAAHKLREQEAVWQEKNVEGKYGVITDNALATKCLSDKTNCISYQHLIYMDRQLGVERGALLKPVEEYRCQFQEMAGELLGPNESSCEERFSPPGEAYAALQLWKRVKEVEQEKSRGEGWFERHDGDEFGAGRGAIIANSALVSWQVLHAVWSRDRAEVFEQTKEYSCLTPCIHKYTALRALEEGGPQPSPCPCLEWLLVGQALDTWEILITASIQLISGNLLRKEFLVCAQII